MSAVPWAFSALRLLTEPSHPPALPIWLTAHRQLFTSARIRAIYDALADGLRAYINGQNTNR